MGALANISSGLGTRGMDPQEDMVIQPCRKIRDHEAQMLYHGNGYARRLIDDFPALGTMRGAAVGPITSVDQKGQQQVRADPLMAGQQESLDVWDALMQAWIYARVDGAGYILPVTRESGGTRLEQPLDLDTLLAVDFLMPLTYAECRPALISQDISDGPLFGKPIEYSVAPRLGGGSMRVHGSRVLVLPGAHVLPDRFRENNFRWDSIFQAVIDQLSALDMADKSRGLFAHRRSIPTLRLPGLQAKSTSDERAKFLGEVLEEIHRFMSVLNMIPLGPKDELTFQNQSAEGLDGLAADSRTAFAAVGGYPQTRLYGETPSGLNTDGQSHKDLMQDAVSQGQRWTIKRPLRRLSQMLYRAKEGPWQGQEPKSWGIIFNPLEPRSAQEIADERAKYAETDERYITMGVYTAADVRKARFSEAGWGPDVLAEEPEIESAPERPLVGYVTALPAMAQQNAEGLLSPEQAEIAVEYFAGAERAKAFAASLTPIENQPAATNTAEGQPPDSERTPPEVPQDSEETLPPEAEDAVGEVLCEKVCFVLTSGDLERQVLAARESLGVSNDLTPHVTVLFMGDLNREVANDLGNESMDFPAMVATPEAPQLFGDLDTLVVGLDVPGLQDVRSMLMERHAHQVMAEQHSPFRPHVTIGKADAVPDDLQLEAMVLDRLELWVDGERARVWPLRADGDESASGLGA